MTRRTTQKKKSNKVVLFVIIAGLLLFGVFAIQKFNSNNLTKFTKVSGALIVAEHLYTNTTYGFALKLPDNWTTCEDRLQIIVGEKIKCSLGAANKEPWFTIVSTAQTDIPYPLRKNGETFNSWVKRSEDYFNSAYDANEITIKANYSDESNEKRHEILVKKSFTNNKTGEVYYISNSYYIELRSNQAWILNAGIDSVNSKSIDSIPLQEFASNMQTFPVLTGDLTGQVSKYFSNQNGSGGTEPGNYRGTLLNADKKTEAATITLGALDYYLIRLTPGTYYFKDFDGKYKKTIIKKGEITKFDIKIPMTEEEINALAK